MASPFKKTNTFMPKGLMGALSLVFVLIILLVLLAMFKKPRRTETFLNARQGYTKCAGRDWPGSDIKAMDIPHEQCPIECNNLKENCAGFILNNDNPSAKKGCWLKMNGAFMDAQKKPLKGNKNPARETHFKDSFLKKVNGSMCK